MSTLTLQKTPSTNHQSLRRVGIGSAALLGAVGAGLGLTACGTSVETLPPTYAACRTPLPNSFDVASAREFGNLLKGSLIGDSDVVLYKFTSVTQDDGTTAVQPEIVGYGEGRDGLVDGWSAGAQLKDNCGNLLGSAQQESSVWDALTDDETIPYFSGDGTLLGTMEKAVWEGAWSGEGGNVYDWKDPDGNKVAKSVKTETQNGFDTRVTITLQDPNTNDVKGVMSGDGVFFDSHHVQTLDPQALPPSVLGLMAAMKIADDSHD